MTNQSNDNGADDRPRTPDAHGQAALILVESLIHALVARSVLPLEDAIQIIDVASAVKTEVAEEANEARQTMRRSLALLQDIGNSLRTDLPYPTPVADPTDNL